MGDTCSLQLKRQKTLRFLTNQVFFPCSRIYATWEITYDAVPLQFDRFKLFCSLQKEVFISPKPFSILAEFPGYLLELFHLEGTFKIITVFSVFEQIVKTNIPLFTEKLLSMTFCRWMC